ncbi:CHAT domain-containing protein [Virgisporangium ochraceum]|uniref:CHAT domain-containing protein n=1 Tax=Virgisporangium ochraceum TaxID=65505 RepID=UPI001942F0A8|nr:CHAT domain-containing protein [Virgisporangium ochraceum]
MTPEDTPGWHVQLWSQPDGHHAELVATAPLGEDLVRVAAGEHGQWALAPSLFGAGTDTADRRAMGERLFMATFRGEVARRWSVERAAATPAHPVRVRLDVASPVLRALPWELVREGTQWLYRRDELIWSRGPMRGPEPAPPAEHGPLRVLVVVCSPDDPQFRADDEIAHIEAALAGINGLAHTEVLDGPSRYRLAETIDDLRPHVLHVIGHGMPRPGTGGAALHFNWMRPNRHPVDHPEPWELMAEHVDELSMKWKPRLVVLNACRTAGDPMEVIGGLAAAFLDSGVRAVVSMQADIDSPAAVIFSSALYRAIADSCRIDKAVALARRAIALQVADTDCWALPVLDLTHPPGCVLPRSFVADPHLVADVRARRGYADLRRFLDRSTERRTAWWTLDPPMEPEPVREPGRSLLVIGGSADPKTRSGKTWLVYWSLLACFLRGNRVTYVDLSSPVAYGDPTRRAVAGGVKDWTTALRMIRDACQDPRQPEPLPCKAFYGFNAVLNALLRGAAPPTADIGEPVRDEGLGFDDDVSRPDGRKAEIFATFFDALAAVSPDRLHVIALDNVHRIMEGAFDDVFYPLFLGPVAARRHRGLRVVVTGQNEWLDNHLPSGDHHLCQRIEVGGFAAGDYMRLARDYCRRNGLAFERLEILFQKIQELLYGGGYAPVTSFDEIKAMATRLGLDGLRT